MESGSISGSGTCAQYLVSEVHLDQTLIPISDWTGPIYSSQKKKKSVGTLILCTDPELDEEECVVWPFFIQLLQASFLLRELVINLPHIYRLQHGVIVARV